MVVIKRCSCKSEFQDKRYGKKLRVMNLMDDNKGFRCTVCEKTITR